MAPEIEGEKVLMTSSEDVVLTRARLRPAAPP